MSRFKSKDALCEHFKAVEETFGVRKLGWNESDYEMSKQNKTYKTKPTQQVLIAKQTITLSKDYKNISFSQLL